MELFDAVRAVVVLITPNPVTRIDRSVVSLQPPATPHVPVARRHVYKALEDFGLATAHGHGHRALILDLVLPAASSSCRAASNLDREDEEGRALQKARQHVHDLLDLRSN